jgi:hypothetical protein
MSNCLPEYSAAPKGSFLLPQLTCRITTPSTRTMPSPTFQEVLTGKTTARAFLDGWGDQLEKA